MVESWKPDAVISTHFLTSLIGVIYSNKTGKPTFTVITDLAVHPLWVWEGTRRYYVGLERTAQEEPLKGKDVVVSGIPLRKGFWEPPDKAKAREELGYPRDSTVVLLSAGSYASVKVEPLLLSLRDMGTFVVLLAGRKREAYNRFVRFYKEAKIRGTVYPFVDFIPKIMAASDLFITKAGGVSVAEALAIGLPMVFVNNMPGQEELNAKIVEEEGAGVNACTPEEAIKVVESLIKDTERLEDMGRIAKKLGKPKAALRIIGDVISVSR
jgi:processive 1,2-diacylglycerol beta-glucosyltransferase